jgi:NAD(P)-dependent dehydrogenase (short-subunit alcohol dehydrogenase family)
MEDIRFKGKHIIITGAGGNFGREGCLFFASKGCKVTALDLNQDALDETHRQVKLVSGDILCIKCDICSSDAVDSSVEKASGVFGVPDLLW